MLEGSTPAVSPELRRHSCHPWSFPTSSTTATEPSIHPKGLYPASIDTLWVGQDRVVVAPLVLFSAGVPYPPSSRSLPASLSRLPSFPVDVLPPRLLLPLPISTLGSSGPRRVIRFYLFSDGCLRPSGPPPTSPGPSTPTHSVPTRDPKFVLLTT